MDISKKLRESLLGEDYPNTWDVEVFKGIGSYKNRIEYCEEHLTRLGSGSSRIVYKIDDEKVLKLAKNRKGLAQNKTEIEYGKYYDISDIVAHIFDYDLNNLWVEMELATKVSKPIFKKIVGFDFNDYSKALHNYGVDSGNSGSSYRYQIDNQMVEDMWENEFIYDVFNFVGNYGIPIGDLIRTSTYGVVKRDGQDSIVIIDYGLTHEVASTYYSI